jgi:membrane associated rhomboid family serine protease
MEFTITLAIVLITGLISYFAFENRGLMERLIFWPPAISRGEVHRFISYGLIHADWQHLLFNMITLFFFGTVIEQLLAERIGAVGFIFFYLSALLVSILPGYLRHRRDAGYRSLGASGAVSAVLFAYILFAPWSMILVFFIPVPAIVFAVAYVGYSIWADRRGGDNVNHSAHLWGAAYGVLFIVLLEPAVLGFFWERLINPGS